MSIEKIINEAWEIKDQVNQDSDKDYISHKIENLSLFLKEIRLLKSQ